MVLGWDNPSTPLRAHIKTPSGKPINEKSIETVRGQTCVFYRIPLPHLGERDDECQFIVDRVPPIEGPPLLTDVRYFFLVVSTGGPKLTYLGGPRRVYTGDPIDLLVDLHYRICIEVDLKDTKRDNDSDC